MPTTPAATRTRAATGRRIPEPDAQRLEAWCQQRWFASTTPAQQRHALAISVGLYGLRQHEIAHAKLWQLDHRNTLTVLTAKHGRPRDIAIDPRLADALRTHAPTPAGPNAPLLRTGRGNIASQQLFDTAMEQATPIIGTAYTFHCLRHTAAMRLYDATHDVLLVMHMLGHKSLGQTHVYLQRHLPAHTAGFPNWHPARRPRAFNVLRPPKPESRDPWWQTLWDSNARRLTRDGRPDRWQPLGANSPQPDDDEPTPAA